MKIKMILIILVVCIGLGFSACTAFEVEDLQYVMVPQNQSEALGDFDVRVSINKFAGLSGGTNIFNITSDVTKSEIKDAIEKEIFRLGGSAATNISIKYGPNFGQMLLNGLTMTIWAPTTARIRGTVIK